MICSRCGNNNLSSAHFCASCGAALVASAELPETPVFPENHDTMPRRDLGELISNTFEAYRRNFWSFFFIALLPQIPLTVAAVTPRPLTAVLTLMAYTVAVLAFGATVHAVCQQHLNRPVYVGQSYSTAWQRASSLIVAALIVVLVLVVSVLLMFIVVGIPLFFYVLVIWYFFIPSIMLEGMGSIDALRRSRDLVMENWWRVFGIGVAFALVIIVLALVSELPASILDALSPALGDIFRSGVQVLFFPVTAIGATLVYIDLRIRKEGYSLERMAAEIGPA